VGDAGEQSRAVPLPPCGELAGLALVPGLQHDEPINDDDERATLHDATTRDWQAPPSDDAS